MSKMSTKSLAAAPLAFAAALSVSLLGLAGTACAQAPAIPVSEINKQTHIHGIAVDRANPRQLLIATHGGFFRAGPDGRATRVSEVQDFMGFNPHPAVADLLFASGHPARGGNLGFVTSSDGGKTWTQLSPGVNGPVDFHQMAVSRADPTVIFGVYGTLQVSRDGGRTWRIAGPAPAGVIALAASSKDARTLYAARTSGLYVSTDSGLTWRPLLEGAAATMVETTADGRLFTFVAGRGLMKADEGASAFTVLNADWGGRVLIHFAADHTDPLRVYAVTDDSRVLASTDGGRTWKPFGG
jgi:photosystem II stability/assembly factor-like uncharacterized protein